ncbi:MAG: hypothetical protein DME28_08935 [Verrucomicrobia bacterium]|nr:MAG: hypothetical protein DME41_02340 [Verrucomicrobiota bacterium]PYL93484.1 MAG: hypothetical protein DME28_08935 [Verrucomicrobiota bacterium]
MKTTLGIMLALSVSVLVACSKRSSGTADLIPIYPVKVGEKTDFYEVVGPNDVKFAEGVKIKLVPEAGGKSNGFVFMRPNGEIGGYMRCECSGATTSSCRTTNDNPNHPACEGGCTDSEGNLHGCTLAGPLPGPPRDPTLLSFRAAESK